MKIRGKIWPIMASMIIVIIMNLGAHGKKNSIDSTKNQFSSEKLINYHSSLENLLSFYPKNERKLSILVSKSKYRLYVKNQGNILKSYPIVLGTSPRGQKLMEGDRKTPEGNFQIRAKYPHKSWTYFLWIDYPNAQSRINHREAKQLKKIPKNSTIGGDVGIHGVPDDADDWIDEKSNWTWGCISLKNADVTEIYETIPIGTAIRIVP